MLISQTKAPRPIHICWNKLGKHNPKMLFKSICKTNLIFYTFQPLLQYSYTWEVHLMHPSHPPKILNTIPGTQLWLDI